MSGPASAHEFWIEPLEYQLEPDGKIQGNLVNGQFFEGVRLPFQKESFEQFIQIRGDETRAVRAWPGSRPALDVEPIGPGLTVIAYQSTLSRVAYESFEEFASFAEHKDFPDIEKRHAELGYPTENFAEIYSRYAKTLVAVGEAIGDDRRVGLEVEIVALTNPYRDELSDGMRVQVFYRGEVRAKAQVEVFGKAPDGTVQITQYRTDGEGVAVVPVKRGHQYLFDSVVLRVPAPEIAQERDAVWETLWASLTFSVPD
jgi:hypothetical protein